MTKASGVVVTVVVMVGEVTIGQKPFGVLKQTILSWRSAAEHSYEVTIGQKPFGVLKLRLFVLRERGLAIASLSGQNPSGY